MCHKTAHPSTTTGLDQWSRAKLLLHRDIDSTFRIKNLDSFYQAKTRNVSEISMENLQEQRKLHKQVYSERLSVFKLK